MAYGAAYPKTSTPSYIEVSSAGSTAGGDSNIHCNSKIVGKNWLWLCCKEHVISFFLQLPLRKKVLLQDDLHLRKNTRQGRRLSLVRSCFLVLGQREGIKNKYNREWPRVRRGIPLILLGNYTGTGKKWIGLRHVAYTYTESHAETRWRIT